MSSNPLFPDKEDSSNKPAEQADWHSSTPIVPTFGAPKVEESNAAADLIRQKVARLYADEPNTQAEIQEAEAAKPRSKHQEFMYNLSTSGKSLAEIQTEWHNYYTSLPDNEKHEVWQEFYETTKQPVVHHEEKPKEADKPKEQAKAPQADEKGFSVGHFQPRDLPSDIRSRAIDRRSAAEIRQVIKAKISAGGKLHVKHHIQSLFFGLGMGGLVIFIFLFGLFNQILIAPFIQPGRNISDTSIIIDPNGAAPSPNPQVIIPKIDVEIPVIYSQASINEADIENSLEDGVVHYPTTVLPGQKGNAAFFGHSSNNVFTPGQYKYAFVLLHELVDGDTFYLTNNDKVYIYKVISKTIVAPTDVGVLGPVAGQVATATLITCDPPGTSLNRLIVVGQQISPDPSTDSSPTAQTASAVSVGAAVNLPGDGPSLWSDITKSAFGKVAMTLAIIIGAALLIWSVRLVIQGL